MNDKPLSAGNLLFYAAILPAMTGAAAFAASGWPALGVIVAAWFAVADTVILLACKVLAPLPLQRRLAILPFAMACAAVGGIGVLYGWLLYLLAAHEYARLGWFVYAWTGGLYIPTMALVAWMLWRVMRYIVQTADEGR